MRKHLLGLMLIAGLAGCSSEPHVTADGAAKPASDDAGMAPALVSPVAPRQSAGTFAALPDRGELLAYGGARKVHQSGAYTWHPVSISEEHALNAIGSGRMAVNTPGGETLNLQYERHEEQPDGNWTWIGRSPEGGSAVLTFGPKAVFGTIANGNMQYRVRTDRTGTWVVETDPSLVVGNGQPTNGTDMLIPPREARALAAAASRQMAASEAVSTKAGAVVDLVLGYSSTFAAELGSQAAVITMLSNLTAAANTAYASSGVTMRLRLVHVLPVDYADATSNADALRQLTGYNEETRQPITPNAAFNALRAARNEYGGDLVAFVRRYRTPDQDGCGIAWLLGEDDSGISAADEAFGYAVVSNGYDVDERDNSTYFCSTYSLAHELGHLMGQAHNRENAREPGVHPYSYGYREPSSTGFYTIMAYPLVDAAQVEAPVFASPAIQYSGRPAGTATADNVRSMNQTMPIVSQFRATVVPLPGPARNDVDGDGRSDLIFRSAHFGRVAWWRMNGATVAGKGESGAGSAYTLAAAADFNGDGRTDLAWTNASGWVVLHLANSTGTGFTSTPVIGTYNPAIWTLVGAGDTNADGRADLIFRSTGLGRVAWWQLNGANIIARRESAAGSAYTLAAIGDFNGDGRADLAWTNSAGWVVLHLANSAGTAFTSTAVVGTYNTNLWSLVASGDTDGDGRSDLIFRSDALGRVAWWRMNSGAVSARFESAAGSAYRLAATGDFNGDGRADLAWTNASGWVVLHLANSTGTGFTSTPLVGTYGPAAWALSSWGK